MYFWPTNNWIFPEKKVPFIYIFFLISDLFRIYYFTGKLYIHGTNTYILICFIRLAIFLLPSANSIMQTIEQSRTVFNQKKRHRKYAVYLAIWRFEEKRRNCSSKVMVWHASHFLLFPADVAKPSGIGKENEVLRRET